MPDMKKKDKRFKHGLCELPEYQVWKGMRKRCNSPKDEFFYRYGGRGIKICARWNLFSAFYYDMGPRPSAKHTLDRINNDGNYTPKNCRWATQLQQAKNRTKAPALNLFSRKNISGMRGVDVLPSGSFRAKFAKKHLGVYKTSRAAKEAYRAARKKAYAKLFQNKSKIYGLNKAEVLARIGED